MTTASTLTVFVRDCAVDLPVGIHPHEQTGLQRVIVNVTMTVEPTDKINALADTADYESIRNFIVRALPSAGHTPLLETVAEKILDACFEIPCVRSATVRLEKPRIFPETASVGIELQRQRHIPLRRENP